MLHSSGSKMGRFGGRFLAVLVGIGWLGLDLFGLVLVLFGFGLEERRV